MCNIVCGGMGTGLGQWFFDMRIELQSMFLFLFEMLQVWETLVCFLYNVLIDSQLKRQEVFVPSLKFHQRCAG